MMFPLTKGNEYTFAINSETDPDVNEGKIVFVVCIVIPGYFQPEGISTTTDHWMANTWYHIAGTYDGVSLKIYVNGVLENSRAVSGELWTQEPTYAEYPLSIGADTWMEATPPGTIYGRLFFFNGAVDEVKIYNYARTGEEIWNDYSGGSVLPLSVSISPLSASVNVGNSVTFTSTVSGGTPPYSYQWYLNGNPVSGATSTSWTFTPTTTGNYTIHLNVTDNLGNTAKSNDAVVTVAAQLTVSISPMSASVLVGQSVAFTSTVSGGYTPYSYQWYLNGNPVSGATSASWTFTPTTSGIYYIHLKATDAKGNTMQSGTARITVATIPVGGYSYSIQFHAKAEPILPYIALIVALTIVFTRLRPKTKRKR
jgi:hypothetical protein